MGRQLAVSFQEALTGSEALESWDEGSYFGFPVDAGLGCICNQVLHQAFCDFVENWQREHPEGNFYDDYFAALFAASYQAHGEWQREGGDWLNWFIPGTGYHLPIFQSALVMGLILSIGDIPPMVQFVSW